MARWVRVGVLLAAVLVVGACGTAEESSKPAGVPRPVAPSATEITYLCPPENLCGVVGDGSATGTLPLPGVDQDGGTTLSPDGTQAATANVEESSDSATDQGVTLRSSTGGTPRVLLRPSTYTTYRQAPTDGASAPAWNPQGTEVAVVEPSTGGKFGQQGCEIWVVPVSGRGAHPLDATGSHPLRCDPATELGQSLSWNPTGTEVAYATQKGLMAVPVAGGAPKVIRATPGETLGSVAWSPEGSRILAEVVEGTDRVESYRLVGRIESFPVDGGKPTTVIPATTNAISFYSPGLAWAPDGRRFVFVASPAGSEGSGARIVTADPDGRNVETAAELDFDRPLAITGWSRTRPASSGLGLGVTPTTPPPTYRTQPPATVPPVQAPVAGPVPAVTGLNDLADPPAVAPGGNNPPNTLVGKDLVIGTGPAATIDSTVSIQSESVIYQTGQPEDPSTIRTEWATVSPTTRVSDTIAGYRDGIIGMRPGGIRELVVPVSLGAGPYTTVVIIRLLSVTSFPPQSDGGPPVTQVPVYESPSPTAPAVTPAPTTTSTTRPLPTY